MNDQTISCGVDEIARPRTTERDRLAGPDRWTFRSPNSPVRFPDRSPTPSLMRSLFGRGETGVSEATIWRPIKPSGPYCGCPLRFGDAKFPENFPVHGNSIAET